MTARHLIEVDANTIETVAFRNGLHIERSADEERMYVVCDGICFWAESPDVTEVTC